MRKPYNKLAEHRMRNIMSQQDVANELGISQPYYGRLERNPENISIGMAKKLKTMFKVGTIDDLISDAI